MSIGVYDRNIGKARGIKYGMTGKHHSEETKRKISLNRRGISSSRKGKSIEEIFGIDIAKKMREALIKAQTGKHHSLETKMKMSIKGKKHWQDPKYIKIMIKARRTQPNKAELKLNSILQSILPNEHVLNVKGNIMVLGGKIPDFVNINGRKKVIELFGNYWHKERLRNYTETEKGRIEYFKKFGWDTLIIWEQELNNEESLKEKLLKHNGCI